MIRKLATFALFAALAAPVVAQPATAPEAVARWTIASPDCTSVHADGEPWDECGFQSFAMNADGSRTLTVSTRGIVQLWDGEGRELRRIDWPDEPRSGASGYPNGEALIVGDLGIVIVHHNQLLVLDLADGRERLRRVLDLMLARDLRLVGNRRVFAETRRHDWEMAGQEIDFATGTLRPIGDISLGRVGRDYWVTGFPGAILHRDGMADVALPRSCMPVDARYCTWRNIPGRDVHVLDIPANRWLTATLDAPLDQFVYSSVVAAGERLFLIVCGRSPGATTLRPCRLLDFPSGREIHRFEADNFAPVGAIDEQGRPEVRLSLGLGHGRREDRRVSADGTVRVIDPQGRAALDAPGRGMLLPVPDGQGALLVNRDGSAVARFPFAPKTCGNGWPTWTGWCRFSADGRLWLVPSGSRSRRPVEDRVDLVLYALPSAPPEPARSAAPGAGPGPARR